MKIVCSQCGGSLENVRRADHHVFYFCRHCKLPHDKEGNGLFTTHSLAERFNVLQSARNVVGAHHPKASPVARTALEMSLIQSMQEAYFAGMKDGVLLAYSQDFQKGEPMEKFGVQNEELKAELYSRYNDLMSKKVAMDSGALTKEAAAINAEIEAVKAKINELDK